MIRLCFLDTYCNSLQELRAFLLRHAGEEKNGYHASVAEQLRRGVLERWLRQEQAFLEGRGSGAEAALLQSLADAVRDEGGKLDSDQDIYAWMLRVFCSLDGVSISLNPYRFIKISRLILRYDREKRVLEGRIIYVITKGTKEMFELEASLGGRSETLCRISADAREGFGRMHRFKVATSLPVSGENMASIRFTLGGEAVPAKDTFFFTGTDLDGVFLVSHGGSLHVSRREGDAFYVVDPALEVTSVGAFNARGVAAVNGGAWYICADGRLLNPSFRKVRLTGEGLAAIWRDDGRVSFVTADGEQRIFSEGLSQVRFFSEGFLPVRRASNGDWAYMGRDGMTIGSYARPGDFRGGRAAVLKKSWMGERWLEIDREFHERELDAPPERAGSAPAPSRFDGMHIGPGLAPGSEGLYTDDGYPVPVTFNLPERKEILLFEL